MSKLVTIYSSVGESKKEVRTDAENWGELQVDLNGAGVSIDGKKVILKQTKATLESSEAVLPTTDFAIMLIPGKVKSGNEKKH